LANLDAVKGNDIPHHRAKLFPTCNGGLALM
jgi:hypothetical protein